jgi:hypothetical protein
VFDGKAIAIFRYFVIIILYLVIFSTRYIFYSIYFIIKYNIELIFVNTSIIEYLFFSPELHHLLVYLYSKYLNIAIAFPLNTSMRTWL